MNPSLYLGFVGFLSAFIYFLYSKNPKLHFFPLILIIYAVFMCVAQFDIFHSTPIQNMQKQTISTLLPAMIFLMMLGFNLKSFQSLGIKTLLAFFFTSISIIGAFIFIYYLFESFLWENASQSFATLSGSWSGGSINMIAVQKSIGMPDIFLSSVIIVDTITYSFWLMFLLFLVPFASKFNHWTKSHVPSYNINISCCIQSQPKDYVRILTLAIIIGFSIDIFSFLLPQSTLLSHTFYSVILSTILGLLASFTPLSKLPAEGIANSMLYLIIALIASQAQLPQAENISLFLSLAFAILILHALMMLVFAKLFKLDLFSIAIASLAHIGGTAGATVLASAYHKSLIPVAILMATAGYLLGTFIGLFIAYALGAFA